MNVDTVVRTTQRIRRISAQHLLVGLTATVVEIGLRCCTVPQVAHLLGVRLGSGIEPDPSAGSRAESLPPSVLRRYREVRSVFRHWPFGDTCLRRALVLGRCLRHLGPTLVIGVRRDPAGALAAHAWIVIDGVAVDPLAHQFAALRSLSEG